MVWARRHNFHGGYQYALAYTHHISTGSQQPPNTFLSEVGTNPQRSLIQVLLLPGMKCGNVCQ